MRLTYFILTILIGFYSNAVLASQTFNYLSESTLNTTHVLPAFPTLTSEEGKAEMQTMLSLQASRTEEQTARCKKEGHLSVELYKDVLGDCLNEANLPMVKNLFDKVEQDLIYFARQGKDAFQRPRPFLSNPALHAIFPTEKSYSYPSGHALYGVVSASILSKLSPASEKPLLERGRQIGFDRAIGGMHYPSDIAAGRVLGEILYNNLAQNPAFASDLEAAKNEYLKTCSKRK